MGSPPEDADVGDALFVAGYAAGAPSGDDDPRLAELTRLAAVLLGSGSPWRLRRLAPHGGERDAPTRGNVRRELDAMLGRPASHRLIVIAAELTRTVEGLALVCAPTLGGFREDASVPLEWIGMRLRRAAPAATALVLVTSGTPVEARAALDVLGGGGDEHAIVVEVDAPAAALAAVVDAVARTGVDPIAGVVTPRGLCEVLGRRATAAVQASTSARALVPSGANPTGEALPGGFRLGAELGRGRFGVVHRAHHALTGREVAVKTLHADGLADARAFVAEVEALARIDHPGVVRVLHADTTSAGRPFVAMELIAGGKLDALLSSPVAPALARTIGEQLVAALAASHAAGVVHGDVAPTNVMIIAGEVPRVVLVDFGLARLRADDPAGGGTPAYMPPELLRGEPATPRADVFSAALVYLRVTAGAAALTDRAAALTGLAPGPIRAALTQALSDDPAARFADAGEFARALGIAVAPPTAARPPFRMAAPFGEADRGDFHGRGAEIERLLEQVLFRRAVVYVAPSGTGKTSLLRAGLVPRLRGLDVEVAYVACRAGATPDLGAALGAPGVALPELLAARASSSPRRLVVIVDQIEAALTDASDPSRGAAVLEALAPASWPADAPIAVVWSVREEYLARLLDRAQRLEPGVPIIRLGPLSPEVAREVLTRTLEARDVEVEPALLDELIGDLTVAAAGLSAELGWGDAPAVYPPHLQLAGSVLYAERAGGAIDRALYRRVGGLATILAEHLRHVLEDELAPSDTARARALLQAMVSTSHLRVARGERELVARVADAPPAEVIALLHQLRERGVIVATPGADGEPLWDLAHDSLVARVESWISATDLPRQRALELVRDHLRRGRADAPSLLTVAELREVRLHLAPAELAALDAEWSGRPGAGPRAATDLVAASRQALRHRRVALAAVVAAVLAAVAFLALRWQAERDLRRRQLALRDRDIGTTELVLRAFDWDPERLAAIPTTAAGFSWELRRPDPANEDAPGALLPASDLSTRALPTPSGTVRADRVDVRGGPAVLVIARRDRLGRACTPSIVPVRRLPGHGDPRRRLVIDVPTCEATRAGTIPLDTSSFLAGGRGEPEALYPAALFPPEVVVTLPAYAFDRTELPRSLLDLYLAQHEAHGLAEVRVPDTDQLQGATGGAMPASGVTWSEARAICRWLGKDLPTLDQWDRALRGPLNLPGGANPCPRRTFAWCGAFDAERANLRRAQGTGPRPVGSAAGDVSVEGFVDLVGNVSEWTLSPTIDPLTVPAGTWTDPAQRTALLRGPDPFASTRGCNWSEVECTTDPLSTMPLANPRARRSVYFNLGFRCAL